MTNSCIIETLKSENIWIIIKKNKIKIISIKLLSIYYWVIIVLIANFLLLSLSILTLRYKSSLRALSEIREPNGKRSRICCSTLWTFWITSERVKLPSPIVN